MMRDSQAARHLAHNQATGSSSLPPATNRLAVLAPMVLHRRPSIPGQAQLAEHSTDNREVAGSTPAPWTNRNSNGRRGRREPQALRPRRPDGVDQMCVDSSASGERRCHIPGAGGSIPSLRTIARVTQPGQSLCLPSSWSPVQIRVRAPSKERIRSSMVELSAHNRSVEGSIPFGSTSRSIPPTEWVGGSMVEQRAFNPLVASSSLARPTSRVEKKRGLVAQLAAHPVLTREVEGSIPSESTSRGTLRVGSSADLEHRVSTPGVAGSNPARPSKPSRRLQPLTCGWRPDTLAACHQRRGKKPTRRR